MVARRDRLKPLVAHLQEKHCTAGREEGQREARLNQINRNDDDHFTARKWKRVGSLSGEWAMLGANSLLKC